MMTDAISRRRATPIVATLALLLWTACADGGTAPEAQDGMDMPADTMAGDTTTSPTGLTNDDVWERAKIDSSWTWWEHSDALLDRAGDSPHAEQIRTRYNTAAATQLDSQGRLGQAANFPDSSAVVKEVYQEQALVRVLVMFKAEGDPNAGHGAWLWAEFDNDGVVLHSIAQDNGECHNCHVTGVDHMRMPGTH